MADANTQKEVVIKLTAATKEFISDIQNADKAVKGMNNDIAGAEKLAKELSDQFKQIDKVFMAINSNYISKRLAQSICNAQLELNKFLKTVSDMSSANGINDVSKSTKDAAKVMADAGKDVAVSLKDTSKVASDASKKISDAEKTASEAGKKIKEDLNSAVKDAGMDKPFTVTASVDGKEIESAVKDAQKAVEDASNNQSKTLPFNTEASVDGASIDATVKDVRQLSKDLSGMKETVGSVAEVFTAGLGSGGDSVDKVGESIEDLGAKTKESATEMVEDLKNIGKEASSVSEDMSSRPGGIIMSKEEAEERKKNQEAIDAEIESKKKLADANKKVADSSKAEKKETKSLDNEWVKGRATSESAQRQGGYRENLSDVYSTMGRSLSDMYAKIRGKLNPEWAETERRVARLSARLNELKRQQEKVANTRYHSAEWNDYTKELQRTRAAMNALEVQQRNLETQMQSGMFGQQEAEDAKKKYSALGITLEELRKHFDEVTASRAALKEGTGKPGSENPEGVAIGAEIVAIQRQIDMTRASGSGLFSKLRKHTHSESKKISTILKNTLNHIKSFFSKITHLSNSRGTERGLKRIADAFTRMWGMFRTRLKRRFISAVFEDAKQDMVQLAKAFPSMNDAISGVVNSAKQLGAQLIAILQPIITAVGPLVTKVLDAATVAADKIAQFTAKLFGQDLYGKASKGNYDFVKSMDDTTKSVNNADDALEDYSSNLLGFDKLNQLQAVNNSTGATIKAEETEPVKDNAFNKWAEELNELYNNKDWDGFGRKLAEGLNTAVNWINNQDWDALSDKVTGFIANIQEAFNGFIDAFDAEAVGTAIANIGNLLIKSWNQLVKPVEEGGFDFRKLGEKIGTIIATALKDIHWDEAGTAFGNTGSRLVEMLRGILETKFTDAEGEHTLGYGIGKAISTFITNALKTINTDDWATIIADLFENLLDMFIQIFSSGPDLGAKIAEILNKSLKKIPANKLGEAISGLSRTFNALIENIHWGDVASKLGEALSSMDFGSILKSIFFIKMGKGVGNVANSLFGSLLGGGGKGSNSTGLLNKLWSVLPGIIKSGVSLALIATLAGWLVNDAKSSAEAAAKDANERGDVLTIKEKQEWLTGPDSDPFERGVSRTLADFYLTIGSWFSPEVRKFKERSDFANANGYGYNPVEKPFENPWDSDVKLNGPFANPWDSSEKLGDLKSDGQTAALTAISNNTTAMQSVEASTNTSAEAMTKAADYMKSLFESLQKDNEEGQQVTMMIDGYKFGEFMIKQLGTLMHVKMAAT